MFCATNSFQHTPPSENRQGFVGREAFEQDFGAHAQLHRTEKTYHCQTLRVVRRAHRPGPQPKGDHGKEKQHY
jgi:hypothetical protein